MTDAEKLQRIAKLIAPEIKAQPLPESLEGQLRGLASDWMDSPAHRMYGEILMERLNGE